MAAAARTSGFFVARQQGKHTHRGGALLGVLILYPGVEKVPGLHLNGGLGRLLRQQGRTQHTSGEKN